MSSPLTAPYATPATGALGTTVPVTQSSNTTNPTTSPSLTNAYSGSSKMQQWLDKLKALLAKWKWVILGIAVATALLYMRSGRQALCSNLGIACDTRPLPGGVRSV